MHTKPAISRTRRRLISGAAAMGLGTAVPLLLGGCDRNAFTPKFHGINISGVGYGRDFQLKDPDGKVRALADFRDKVVLIFFGFTQCPDVCPTALTRAQQVRQALGKEASRLQVIFVTVDPERDTALLLRQYTAAFDPDFLGLRPEPSELKPMAEEFRVTYRKVPTGSSYTMDHTALSYLYDPKGKLRLAIRHDMPADQLAEDVLALLNEPAH
jgi:protein SCO1